jgi:hypothetical protein
VRSALPIGRLFVASFAALVMAATLPGTSRAAVQVDASVEFEPVASVEFEHAARTGRADVEVWTNKEEGGVYRQGEPMRVMFRTSTDAFVLIYNIDTEGYIHLVYPYGPDDPDRVEGGVTHQVPSRNDPYEMVADGPTGIEYVVAIASPFPFQDLPWYLTGGTEATRAEYDDDDGEDSGVIVGDPYVGMDRVVRRVVPPGREDEVATDDTFFYIERKVDYPRYVCADCHSYGGWYDPYGDICSVVDVRIDATWARFRPLRSRVIRPRYFYMVRSTAPNRYRQWKERWSSVDGRTTLRTRFQVDGQDKFRSRRDAAQRRTPQEFRDIRRPRAGRTWNTPDQVLRRRAREEVRTRDQSGVERDQVRRERARPGPADRSAPQRQRDMQNRDDGRARRDDGRQRDEARQRDETRRREVQERSQRRQAEERQIRERRQEQRRPDVRERRQEQRRPDVRERRQEERRPDPPQARERREERPRSEARETPRPPKSDDPPPSEDRGSRGRSNDERRQDDGDRGRGRGPDRGR